MASIKWVKLLLLMYQVNILFRLGLGEIILTEDREYEVIDVKIPKGIWQKAFRPTPVLKSAATVVIPIHVQPDENEVLDEDEETGEEISEVSEDTEIAPVNDEVVQNPETNVPVPVADVTQAPVQNDPPEEVIPDPDTPIQGQVVRFPCSCRGGQCGCCTGSILDRFRMKACGNITFIPEDFVFDVRMSINNNTVVRRRVSASDPPPICFNPRRAPFVEVCAEISNIRIRNRNAFACLDINADIAGFPIYSASFRCFGLGSSGLQTGLKPKPVSSGPAPVNLFGNGGDNDDEGGFVSNAASAIFDGGEGGGILPNPSSLFGGGSNDDDDGGPLDAIGDVVGEFFEGRRL